MFEPGDQFPVCGVHFRFSQGRKHQDDVRMDILVPFWTPVSMKLGFIMADFYAQNERVLYPGRGDEAGDMYVARCRSAQTLGWEVAAEQLDLERAEAAARRSAA